MAKDRGESSLKGGWTDEDEKVHGKGFEKGGVRLFRRYCAKDIYRDAAFHILSRSGLFTSLEEETVSLQK